MHRKATRPRIVIDVFRRQPLRTLLSGLAVTLAVAVSMTTAAVNAGARRAALREVERLGADTILVRPTHDGGLAVRDVTALGSLPHIIAVASPALEERVSASGPMAGRPVTVMAVTADYAAVRQVLTQAGRFLHPTDDATAERVCVIGAQLSRDLFGAAPPLGRHARLDDQWFTVVGVLSRGEEDVVFVPLSTRTARRPDADPSQRLTAIWLRAAAGRVDEAAAVVQRVLTVGVDGAPKFEVTEARRLLESRDRTQRLFALIGLAMAVLLFLLGGGAIGTVMLASVVERTPEIGLRRAVGATRRDVLAQFLCEAALMSAAGTVTGLALGLVLSWQTARQSGWPVALSPWSIPIIACITLAIGLVAGTSPALRAARIQPIDAILHQ